jgi:hypothetical protein
MIFSLQTVFLAYTDIRVQNITAALPKRLYVGILISHARYAHKRNRIVNQFLPVQRYPFINAPLNRGINYSHYDFTAPAVSPWMMYFCPNA